MSEADEALMAYRLCETDGPHSRAEADRCWRYFLAGFAAARRTPPPATRAMLEVVRRHATGGASIEELASVLPESWVEIRAEWPAPAGEPAHPRKGFTLLELLIVITIIGLVSAAALPTVVSMMQGQPITAAAQLIQGGLIQAQAEAMKAANRRGGEQAVAQTEAETLRGLRLVPESVTRLADGTIDPAQPLVCSTLVPLSIPPAYQDGTVSILGTAAQYPASLTGGRPCLVLEQCPGKWVPAGGGYVWQPNTPTSWAWNLRAGERVSIAKGPPYTIVGPIAVDNPEQFVNYGPPGAATGLTRAYTSPAGQTITLDVEALLLTNGTDDIDVDGYVDNGWDGLDNDGDGAVDELDEWEREVWLANQERTIADSPYRVIRRAIPAKEPRGANLPNGAVIDLTGWAAQTSLLVNRSSLLVNRYSGEVDILLDKAGRFSYDSPYNVPSSMGMDRAKFAHFWIGSRSDIVDAASLGPPKHDAKLLTIDRAGLVSVLDVNPDDPARTVMDARRGAR